MDLLLGSFATKMVPTMTEEQLLQYEAILTQETVDIYNLVIGIQPLPEVSCVAETCMMSACVLCVVLCVFSDRSSLYRNHYVLCRN